MIDRLSEQIFNVKLFFAGAADFTIATPNIWIFQGTQQQTVDFTLEPDTVSQEPLETFLIVAAVLGGQIRPLKDNEFLQLTKHVTVIDRTSKHTEIPVYQHTCILCMSV